MKKLFYIILFMTLTNVIYSQTSNNFSKIFLNKLLNKEVTIILKNRKDAVALISNRRSVYRNFIKEVKDNYIVVEINPISGVGQSHLRHILINQIVQIDIIK